MRSVITLATFSGALRPSYVGGLQWFQNLTPIPGWVQAKYIFVTAVLIIIVFFLYLNMMALPTLFNFCRKGDKHLETVCPSNTPICKKYYNIKF